MNIRIVLTISTVIGMTFGSLLARQTEAAVSQEDVEGQRPAAEAAIKQRQTEEAKRQRVAESRTEANLTDAEPIPAGKRVKVGQRDARVPMIRARMVKLGFLSEENSFAWMLGHPADKVSNPSDLELILDKELSKAIRAFQKAKGIKRTGRIDKATVAALNAAAKQRQAEEERKAQLAALALAKQHQAEEAERQRLAAEAAAKQRQAVEEERKAQLAALGLAKQRQVEEAERQRLTAEAAAKQRQVAEEERKAQVATLALAKQHQAEEAERQRLATEAAAKQRQAEEERKAQVAALALAKQRQAEEAERLADNRKVASIDSASEANEASSQSCNKAKSIIGKYGFEDIETESCEGKIYHFSATRKGKRFSVKINSLTSALTEVKRVLSSAVE